MCIRDSADNVTYVTVDLALDHPVQHLGFARGELEAQRHGFDHTLVRYLLHDDEPVAAALAVANLLVQAKGQPLGTESVSYTQLDVYKRQDQELRMCFPSRSAPPLWWTA